MSELIDVVVSAFPDLAEYIEDPDVTVVSMRATGQIFALKSGVTHKISHSVEAAEHIRRIANRLRERGGDPRDSQNPALEYADSAGNRVMRIIDSAPPLVSLSITKAAPTSTNSLPLTEEALGYDAFRWVSMISSLQSAGIAIISNNLVDREMFIESFARKTCIDRNTALIGPFPRVYIGNDVPVYIWREPSPKEQKHTKNFLAIAASLLPQNIAIATIEPEQFAHAVHLARVRGTRFIMGMPFANSTTAINGLMNWARNSWRSANDEKRTETIEWFVKYIITCERATGGRVKISSIKSIKSQKDKLIGTALFTATPSGLLATEAGKMELDKLQETEEKRITTSHRIVSAPHLSKETDDSKPEVKEKPAAPAKAHAPQPPKPKVEKPRKKPAKAPKAAKSSIFASLIAEASVTGEEKVPKAKPPRRVSKSKIEIDSEPEITETYTTKNKKNEPKPEPTTGEPEHEEIELDDSDFLDEEEMIDDISESKKT